MDTAFSYRRISQEESGELTSQASLLSQYKDIASYCSNNSITLLKDYNEGIKTGDEFREVFPKMINEALIIKPTYIIVREQSRFARDVALTLNTIKELESAGIIVHSIMEGNLTADKTMTGFKAVMDAYQIERGRKHQRLMMERKQNESKPFAKPPLGYKAVDKTWVYDEEGANKVREIFRLFIKDNKKVKEIAVLLNIGKDTIYHILHNSVYLGYFTAAKKFYGKDLSTGKKKVLREEPFQYKLKDIPPIIDEETYIRARKKLIGNTKWKFKIEVKQ